MDNRSASEIVHGFDFPTVYRRLVEHRLVDIEPWLVLEGDELVAMTQTLMEHYPERSLVAFAQRQDCDDRACFDLTDPEHSVVIIHDYASPGWELRQRYSGIEEWLRRATDDFIFFE